MDSSWKPWINKLKSIDENPLKLIRWVLKELQIHEDPLFKSFDAFSDEKKGQLENIFQRLLEHEPISKIFEKKDFFGFEYKTTHDTLDPRLDSQVLIEAVQHYMTNQSTPFSLLDLGTGTGCLIMTLLHLFPHAWGIGVDISNEALQVANTNRINHLLEERLKLLQGNWGEALNYQFDIIISNPPYIKDDFALSPSVKNYDPPLALFGGIDGLDAYRKLFKSINSLCHSSTLVFFEIGYDQSASVPELANIFGFDLLNIFNDTLNIPRICVFKRSK